MILPKYTILVVDDSLDTQLILHDSLDIDYNVLSVTSAHAAINNLLNAVIMPDIILLDIVMPETNGFEFCKFLKDDLRFLNIPVIYISSTDNMQDKLKAYSIGAVDFIQKPFYIEELKARIESHINTSKKIKDMAKQNYVFMQQVTDLKDEIEKSNLSTVYALVQLTEMRDDITGKHLNHISNLCKMIATRLSNSIYSPLISINFIDTIHKASPLHDIGKVSIPDEILNKKKSLSIDEFEIIKMHTISGSEILINLTEKYPNNSILEMGIQLTRSHHERWDGSGYPDGLEGEQIPLPARILAFADVYDALRNNRPYKNAFNHEASMDIIAKEAHLYDPIILNIFYNMNYELKSFYG